MEQEWTEFTHGLSALFCASIELMAQPDLLDARALLVPPLVARDDRRTGREDGEASGRHSHATANQVSTRC
jgi:hypothetical protein